MHRYDGAEGSASAVPFVLRARAAVQPFVVSRLFVLVPRHNPDGAARAVCKIFESSRNRVHASLLPVLILGDSQDLILPGIAERL